MFRSGTALVPVTVTVTDQQGRPVTGLKQADFKIFEDGRLREVDDQVKTPPGDSVGSRVEEGRSHDP